MNKPGVRIQEAGEAMGREEYWNAGMMGLSDKNLKILWFRRVA
jgi:hypothetical protein